MKAQRMLLLAALVLATSSALHTTGAETADQGPTVSIQDPEDGAEIQGETTVSGQASAPNGTIDRVEVQVDDGPWHNATGTTNWTWSWNTTDHADGPHTLRARAYGGDNVSSEATSNVTVEVDNRGEAQEPASASGPPELDVQAPQQGAGVTGTLTVEGVALDPDGEGQRLTVEARVDTAAWTETSAPSGEPFSLELDVSELAAGEHRLTVRATDENGGTAVEEVGFNVLPPDASTAPTEASSQASPALVGVGTFLVLLTLGVGGLVAWGRS